jgi:hypothetical protein
MDSLAPNAANRWEEMLPNARASIHDDFGDNQPNDQKKTSVIAQR